MKNNIILAVMVLIAAKSFGTVVPNSLFSNNMVLQQNIAVPVWGMAKDGEKVTVEFEGQKRSTFAKDGKWMLKLKPLKAGGPFTMTIKGENTIVIENVLVGEVWVCSGQSNMEYRMRRSMPGAEQDISSADYPYIRQYFVARKPSDTFVSDANSKWVPCSLATVTSFTAVGFFFAKELYQTFKIPIGLLNSSVGGTPAENWTTKAALQNNPELKKIAEDYDRAIANYPAVLEKYKQGLPALMEKWRSDSLVAIQAGKPLPRKPGPPGDPAKSGNAGGLYNGMISPLLHYAIRGVIWYQGESNSNKAKQYQTLFPDMINDWRKNWGQGGFPFLYVQVAPFKGTVPEIREAQLFTLKKVTNVAMSVIMDCGDSTDIHPANKKPVGQRLAIAARALAYKEAIEYSGPLYTSYTIQDETIEVRFDHTGKGLMSKGGTLTGFTIAGDDRKFVAALAVIKDRTVVVSAPGVTNPKAVRYGWANAPVINLFNEDGLPASPFRTDVE